MDIKEYYTKVQKQLTNVYSNVNYGVALGDELEIRAALNGNDIKRADWGWVFELDALEDLSINWGSELYIPIIGDIVMASLDYEISLKDQSRLYDNPRNHMQFFKENIIPVTEFMQAKLNEYKIPHIIDMTPSGGHIITYVGRGNAWNALVDIGYLEPELASGYETNDGLKRNPSPGKEKGLVYSGIGRLMEYMSHLVIDKVKVEFPVTISDPYQDSMNMDITGYAYPGYLRTMRAPFSVHRKRERYIPGAPAMVDVIKDEEWNRVLDMMWHLESAADYAQQFSGHLPVAGDNLVKLVEEYKQSSLYDYHKSFDNEECLLPNEGFNRLNGEESVTRVLQRVNPFAKDPKYLMPFVRTLVEQGWHPKHVGNVIKDLYLQEHGWEEDWNLNVASTRANFWARVYGFP